jgi:CTD kinase subunit alpha
MLSQGHSLKDLHMNALRPDSEPVEEDDPSGLADAVVNKAILEEEAYRVYPDKRPHGRLPLLQKGETLEQTFNKEVVAIKYKIRRPQKVLPEEYRTSNVYYRKPGNESVVGFGTYGKVFKAKHIYKGQDVALKRLRMEAEKDGFPITAMREMKILKHLEQREADSVIKLLEVLYEVNVAGSVGCFMAFEYMPHDLTGLLNHPTFSLSDAQKKDLSFQMIDAIGFMHKQGVLHRDIKAANILVSHHGQIKLADFGLARLYDMDRQLHYTNRVVTIWYRAPELLYGQTEYGPPIDVWAAACVIVEIFTKHAIFPGSGRELNQLLKIWEVMGFPTVEEWPGVSKTEWYFMMRPKEDLTNVFKEKYEHRVSAELFSLLTEMLRYDPDKRPTCEDCLKHSFFTTEEPKPARVTELVELGDWHELESKRARKQREADERQKKDLEHDLSFGPPSCGQLVKESRKDKDYKRDRLARQEKRGANFSPIEPESKKVRA